ncbi:hypothetical protein SGRIM128S_01059 [Streptomyces griseomycini]
MDVELIDGSGDFRLLSRQGRGQRAVPPREQSVLQGDLLLDRLRHRHLPLPQQRAGGRPLRVGQQAAAELRHRRTALLQQPPAPPRDLHRLLGLRLGPGLRPVDGRERRPARRGHAGVRHPAHRRRRPQRHPTGDARRDRGVRGPDLPRGETPPALRRARDGRDLPGAARRTAAGAGQGPAQRAVLTGGRVVERPPDPARRPPGAGPHDAPVRQFRPHRVCEHRRLPRCLRHAQPLDPVPDRPCHRLHGQHRVSFLLNSYVTCRTRADLGTRSSAIRSPAWSTWWRPGRCSTARSAASGWTRTSRRSRRASSSPRSRSCWRAGRSRSGRTRAGRRPGGESGRRGGGAGGTRRWRARGRAGHRRGYGDGHGYGDGDGGRGRGRTGVRPPRARAAPHPLARTGEAAMSDDVPATATPPDRPAPDRPRRPSRPPPRPRPGPGRGPPPGAAAAPGPPSG